MTIELQDSTVLITNRDDDAIDLIGTVIRILIDRYGDPFVMVLPHIEKLLDESVVGTVPVDCVIIRITENDYPPPQGAKPHPISVVFSEMDEQRPRMRTTRLPGIYGETVMYQSHDDVEHYIHYVVIRLNDQPVKDVVGRNQAIEWMQDLSEQAFIKAGTQGLSTYLYAPVDQFQQFLCIAENQEEQYNRYYRPLVGASKASVRVYPPTVDRPFVIPIRIQHNAATP